MKTAYFAGGCFWCITPVFYDITGVIRVISGYSGGIEENPSYKDVKAQKTGHRETIAVEYNEDKVSYEELVRTFLLNVDPFDEGGQFIDRGHSYTLAIYYESEEEYNTAALLISQLEKTAGKKVYISIEPFTGFYSAEEYHQNYFKKNPDAFAKEMEESGRTRRFSSKSEKGTDTHE